LVLFSADSPSGRSASCCFLFLSLCFVAPSGSELNRTMMTVMLSQPVPSPVVSGAKQESSNWNNKIKMTNKLGMSSKPKKTDALIGQES